MVVFKTSTHPGGNLNQILSKFSTMVKEIFEFCSYETRKIKQFSSNSVDILYHGWKNIWNSIKINQFYNLKRPKLSSFNQISFDILYHGWRKFLNFEISRITPRNAITFHVWKYKQITNHAEENRSITHHAKGRNHVSRQDFPCNHVITLKKLANHIMT